jgi:hypothetical protein
MRHKASPCAHSTHPAYKTMQLCGRMSCLPWTGRQKNITITRWPGMTAAGPCSGLVMATDLTGSSCGRIPQTIKWNLGRFLAIHARLNCGMLPVWQVGWHR